MGFKQLAKMLLWFCSAPLTRWRYLRQRSVRLAASGMHRSASLSGNGRFDFAGALVLGRRTRVHAQGTGCLSMAEGVWVGDDCELSTGEVLSIGAHASLQNRSTILGHVTLGAGCVCAPNLYISSAWHHFEDDAPLPIRWQDAHASVETEAHKRSHAVEIGEDCWIGINVVIAPKVKVGRGCIIGANSVVTRDLPPYTVAAGAPAKVIRKRLEFSPPTALQASLREHIPYFYCGFQMWQSGGTALEEVLQGGGWLAGPQFTIALHIQTGARVTLTVNSAVVGELRHGSSVVTVAPGISRASFSARPSVDGLLSFAWSCNSDPHGVSIAVISAEQDSE